uniref:Cytochrome c biogenesis protein Ccs1 n=1 Tax=Taenioma perpusillum TaxID=210852 RepID=A0A1Z1MRQ0_9FLOR|nr:cytochrome c biogenesis protein ccs1 [Taenioma perpusillum]ARW68431.1 cytochrome c biogenesis protein ccs1 [Taenioma perpusillum]
MIQFIKLRSIKWFLIKKISSLNFSIFLLLLIVFCIMIGSVIEQDKELLYYQTYYPLNSTSIWFFNWKVIVFFGLDHLYQTYWFVFILFTLALSLVTCTFTVQLPALKNARRWKFLKPVNKMNQKDSNQKKKKSCYYINIIYSLLNYNFHIFHKKKYLYSYKGILGRIAPIFVHVSLIIVLFGSIVSSFCGYTAQEIIPKGEVFHIKNIVKSGRYSNLNLNLVNKVNNFFIEYNPDNSIKQFFSDVSIYDNKFLLKLKKLMFVNSPIIYNHLFFYQTDWNIESLRLMIGHYNNDIKVQIKLIKVNNSNKLCWLSQLTFYNGKQIYFLIFDIKDKVFLCNANGFIINEVQIGEKFYLNGIPVTILDIIVDSGLQIKIDPGITFVYLGFFILMLSTLISYISYSQIWIYINSKEFFFSGLTNRAVLFFEEDMIKIYANYKTSISTKKNLDDLLQVKFLSR